MHELELARNANTPQEELTQLWLEANRQLSDRYEKKLYVTLLANPNIPLAFWKVGFEMFPLVAMQNPSVSLFMLEHPNLKKELIAFAAEPLEWGGNHFTRCNELIPLLLGEPKLVFDFTEPRFKEALDASFYPKKAPLNWSGTRFFPSIVEIFQHNKCAYRHSSRYQPWQVTETTTVVRKIKDELKTNHKDSVPSLLIEGYQTLIKTIKKGKS